MDRRLASALALLLAMAGPATGPAVARDADTSAPYHPEPIKCAEGVERYLPGDYYFCAGSRALSLGRIGTAVSLYESAAGWGDKRAQFNLGLMYYRGEYVPRDQALGLAWLGLAAERGDAPQIGVLALYYGDAPPELRARADALWNKMKLHYADSVALARANARFERETAKLRRRAQRDPLMAVNIVGLARGDASFALARLEDLAAEVLPSGKVVVGTPRPVDAGADRTEADGP